MEPEDLYLRAAPGDDEDPWLRSEAEREPSGDVEIIVPLSETEDESFAPTIEATLGGPEILVPLSETEDESFAPAVVAGASVAVPLSETEDESFAPSITATPSVTGITNSSAWIFTLHGHTFYVLTAQSGKTFVYDMVTRQWHHWFTGESPTWNMHRGIMWKGRAIAADAETAEIWVVDPYAETDNEETLIQRAVTAFHPVRGDHSYRQGSMRLTASVGFPTDTPAEISLRFSDDAGNTWVGPFAIELDAGSYGQVLEWRSLGKLRTPGRIWEITDTGGAVRIEGADTTMEVAR